MDITCSRCKTRYTLTDREFRGLARMPLPCSACGRLLGVIVCPGCGSLFSASFTSAAAREYHLQCRHCGGSYDILLPSVPAPAPREERFHEPAIPEPREEHADEPAVPEPAKHEEPADEPAIPEPAKLGEDPGEPVMPTPAAPERQPRQAVSMNQPGRDFGFRELFTGFLSAFSTGKIAVSLLGTALLAGILFCSRSIAVSLASSPPSVETAALRSAIALCNAVAILFSLTMTAALVSRITIERSFYNRPWGFWKSIRFGGRTALPMLACAVAVLAVLNGMYYLFTTIPMVGPVLFSLLFVPVYLVSFVILVIAVIGFWFYPPLVALKMGGTRAAASAFLSFTRKHNFSLVYSVVILTIVCGGVVAIAALLHRGAFSLALYVIRDLLRENPSGLLGTIPEEMLRVIDLTFFGREPGLVGSMVVSPSSAGGEGGMIIGALLTAFSLLLTAMTVSITSTIAARVFMLIERGADPDDRHKVRLLTMLVLLAAALWIAHLALF